MGNGAVVWRNLNADENTVRQKLKTMQRFVMKSILECYQTGPMTDIKIKLNFNPTLKSKSFSLLLVYNPSVGHLTQAWLSDAL